MKKILTYIFVSIISNVLFAQQIKFNKADLGVIEPHSSDSLKDITSTFIINLTSINEKDTAVLIIGKSSTIAADHYKLTSADTIIFIGNKSTISIAITGNAFSDKDQFLVLKLNDNKGEQIAVDTLLVKNSYPFTATAPTAYTAWNDPKRAEVFIGTNFDFIDSKVTTTDWYGGARFFLPNITNLKTGDSITKPKWGFNSGIYHSRSLSNFGNGQQDSFQGSYYRVANTYPDATGRPLYTLRYDTLKVSNLVQIDNWGLYFEPLKQISSYEKGDFLTNIYIGFHAEIIRRNIVSTYSFDTLGTKSVVVPDTIFNNNTLTNHSFRFAPKNSKAIYYDAYYGASLPVQFLWKNILEAKVTPCLGFGSIGYSNSGKAFLPFYLVQFDLLAKLGGLSLNIGGEVRGYFPNEAPIMSAYLGTSFSISKLADFITK